MRVLDGRDDLRDVRGAKLRVELDAHVDHPRAVLGGVDDRSSERGSVPVPAVVQHPQRHDLYSVGQARHPYPVVGLLRDRARHVRAVAVLVQREAVVADEVVALHEPVGVEIGRAAEASVLGVGHAGVDHGDRHAVAAARAGLARERPSLRGVDAEGTVEVPLQQAPVAGGALPRVVGVERRGQGRGRELVVGHGVLHARLVAKLRQGLRDRVAVGYAKRAVVAGERFGRRRPGRPLHRQVIVVRGRVVVSDDDAVRRDCCRGRGRGSGERRKQRCGRKEEADRHWVTVLGVYVALNPWLPRKLPTCALNRRVDRPC